MSQHTHLIEEAQYGMDDAKVKVNHIRCQN